MLRDLKNKLPWFGNTSLKFPGAGSQAEAEPTGEELLLEARSCCEAGAWEKARTICDKILQERPAHPEALHLMGEIAYKSGDGKVAIEWLHRAIAARPDRAGYQYTLGCALQDEGDLEQAVSAYRRALELNPAHAKAANNLGCLLEYRGDIDAALRYYHAALEAEPGLAQALYNVGNVLKERGNLVEAAARFQEALARQPDNAEWHRNLGSVLHRQGKIEEAVVAFRAATNLDPASHEAYLDLGNALTDKGRHEEAQQCYRQAIRLKPDYGDAHSNLLLTLNYTHGNDPETLFGEHLAWARHNAEQFGANIASHLNDRSLGRRLRVGYISPDFRRHSISFFIEPILAAHDRTHFEIFCYSDLTKGDDVTGRLRDLSDTWRSIAGMTDEQAAELIRQDRIDILVDLAGHTGHNRMLLFARKPAPVQVSYLGYPNTTGLHTMDYRLTDAYADPEGLTERYHTEELVRLPRGFLCYLPPGDSPEVAPLPCLSTGHITFGSFNNFVKLRGEMVRLWADLLDALPDAHLVLKGNGYADPATQKEIREKFSSHGVSGERLAIHGPTKSLADHLGFYSQVDIGLDVYPYNGATTTCEALWMGVPVVTLAGRTHVSRVGASILNQVGLAHCVTGSAGEYVAAALKLARDREGLERLRRNLRQRLWGSPLCDAQGFTRGLESVYRQRWRRWCEDRGSNKRKGMVQPEGPEGDRQNSQIPEGEEVPFRLHIGGTQAKPGWRILNVQPGSEVDYLGDCSDLIRFADNSVDEIYASHVLEHLGYQEKLPRTLREFYRVLKPGGNAKISVPDFEVLCRLFLDPHHTLNDRIEIMRMAFGGQLDEYDFHYVGLSYELLAGLLVNAGFSRWEKVGEFGLFEDASSIRFADTLISLNVIAYK